MVSNKIVCFRKEWLKNVGSPESHIDQAKFQSQTPIESHTFSTFTIKK